MNALSFSDSYHCGAVEPGRTLAADFKPGVVEILAGQSAETFSIDLGYQLEGKK